MTSAAAFAYEYVQGVFVCVNGTAPPSDEEWEAHCQDVERERNTIRGCLIYTAGGGPSSGQRQTLRDAFHETAMPPMSILTNSAAVRGIMTAISWFAGDRLKAFDPSDLNGALRHLEQGGAKTERAAVVHALGQLARRLSLQLPPSIR